MNVQSVDNSINVVEITNDQVVQRIRETIQANVPFEQRPGILERLEVLEKAQSTPSFARRYTEFIAAAANHMTLLAPFIPALTELLYKCL